MTWTYAHTPSTVNRDAVRVLIRDIDKTDQRVQDEEITFALAEEPNIYLAAALLAKTLSVRYGNKADKSVGDLKISYKSSYDMYNGLASELEIRGLMRSANVYCGGLSISEKDTVEEDTDRVKPSFTRGMHDDETDDTDDIWNAS